MTDGKACDTELPRRIQGGGQTVGKSGLGKSHQRIDVNCGRTRGGDNRNNVALYTPGLKLLAIAFQIVEAADPIPCGFCLSDGACHFCRRKGLGPMRHQCGLHRVLNLCL